MKFFNFASELAACGFHVFPVRPGDHRGILRNSATDDLAGLSMLDKRMPFDDVGVLLGERSNVLVLEVCGARGSAELETRGANGQTLPQCPVAQAYNGDAIVFLRNIAGFNGNRHIGNGLTVRGEGGFTLAPPAVDALRGKLIWALPPWEVRPPVAPDWLVGEIVKRTPERGTFRNYATKGAVR